MDGWMDKITTHQVANHLSRFRNLPVPDSFSYSAHVDSS